jgi:hypothetical protein
MSVITDVLIVTMGGEDEAVASINRRLEEDDSRKQQLNRLDAEEAGAGGGKVASTVIYAAAFNFLDIGDFEEAIFRAPWRIPSAVVIYVNPEMGSTYVISPARPGERWKTKPDPVYSRY